MKNNILNVIKIFIFLVIFALLYLFLTVLKKPNSVDLENITGFYAEKKNSLDVVYIGGSACFVYYEPLRAFEKYGIASYDFAANTIQAELYKYMIEEIYTKQKPKLIIIDARAYQYRDKDQPPTSVAYRNVLTGMHMGLNRYKFIEENVPKYLKDSTGSYHFDLKMYHENMEIPSIKRAINILLDKNVNELKGFYFIPQALKMKELERKTSEELPVSDETTKILIDLLEYLKTKDTEVLFVVSPYIETKTEKANFNYVERIIKEHGYDFIDANDFDEEIGVDYNTDFYNYNHMNIFGSDKYTDFLANYIIEHYELPNRKNDQEYNDWHQLLPNFHEMEKNTKDLINDIIESDGYDENIYIKQQ